MSYPATQPSKMQPIIKPTDLFEVPETERFILDINAGKIDVSLANWKELVQTACRSVGRTLRV